MSDIDLSVFSIDLRKAALRVKSVCVDMALGAVVVSCIDKIANSQYECCRDGQREVGALAPFN